MRVRPSVASAAVASTAAVLLLSGCAGDPTVAAVVDGRTITRAEVDDAVDDLSAGGEVAAADVLWTLAIAPAYIDAAEQEGMGVSSEDARSQLGAGQGAGGADGTVAESTVQIARGILSAQALQQSAPEALGAVNDEIAAMTFDVNPRYGEVDLETGTIVSQAAPWIVGAGEAGAEG